MCEKIGCPGAFPPRGFYILMKIYIPPLFESLLRLPRGVYLTQILFSTPLGELNEMHGSFIQARVYHKSRVNFLARQLHNLLGFDKVHANEDLVLCVKIAG